MIMLIHGGLPFPSIGGDHVFQRLRVIYKGLYYLLYLLSSLFFVLSYLVPRKARRNVKS